MRELLIRYLVILIGLLLTGALFTFAAGFTETERGVIGPTMFQSASPVLSTIVMIACFALATAVAVGVGRAINPVFGLFVLGAGIFVIGHVSDTVVDLAFADGSLGLLGVESLFWALLIFGAAAAVFRFTPTLEDLQPPPPGEDRPSPYSRPALLAALSGVLMLPAAWLMARAALPGQTFAAAFLGALLIGLAGRVISPTTTPILLFPAAVLAGAAGHFLAVMSFDAELTAAPAQGDLPALSLVRPIDYAAAALVGVAMGYGWAKSIVHHEAEPTPEAEPA